MFNFLSLKKKKEDKRKLNNLDNLSGEVTLIKYIIRKSTAYI